MIDVNASIFKFVRKWCCTIVMRSETSGAPCTAVTIGAKSTIAVVASAAEHLTPQKAYSKLYPSAAPAKED